MPPIAEQKILNSGVSKDNLSKVYLLPWSITKEIKLCMFQFQLFITQCSQRRSFSKQIFYRITNVFTAKTKQKHFCIYLSTVRLQWLFGMIFGNGGAKNTHIVLNLTPTKVLYGVIDNSRFCTLLNLALFVAKFYIYRCSLADTSLYFPLFETELREKARTEKDIEKW